MQSRTLRSFLALLCLIALLVAGLGVPAAVGDAPIEPSPEHLDAFYNYVTELTESLGDVDHPAVQDALRDLENGMQALDDAQMFEFEPRTVMEAFLDAQDALDGLEELLPPPDLPDFPGMGPNGNGLPPGMGLFGGNDVDQLVTIAELTVAALGDGPLPPNALVTASLILLSAELKLVRATQELEIAAHDEYLVAEETNSVMEDLVETTQELGRIEEEHIAAVEAAPAELVELQEHADQLQEDYARIGEDRDALEAGIEELNELTDEVSALTQENEAQLRRDIEAGRGLQENLESLNEGASDSLDDVNGLIEEAERLNRETQAMIDEVDALSRATPTPTPTEDPSATET